jgi:hypothetical protein
MLFDSAAAFDNDRFDLKVFGMTVFKTREYRESTRRSMQGVREADAIRLYSIMRSLCGVWNGCDMRQ